MGHGVCNSWRRGVEEDCRSGASSYSKKVEQIKSQYLPLEWSIALHLFYVRFLPQGCATWGMRFVIHGEGDW